MTAIEHISCADSRRGGAGHAHAARSLVISWEVSAEALRTSSLPAICAMNGQAEAIRAAWLEWRIHGDRAQAMLRLEMRDGEIELPVAPAAQVERIAEIATGGAPFEHIWATDDREMFAAALRAGRLLYARTSLFGAALGLRGGVYDAPAMRQAK